jgi:hypothetical protein
LEKYHFLSLVKNYTSLTAYEAMQLTALQDDYPYSQIVHNLAARAASDNNMGGKEHLLHMSAIYTTDRGVLKSIMTAEKMERIAVERPAPKVEEAVIKPTVTTVAEVRPVVVPTSKPEAEHVVEETENVAHFLPSDLSGDALLADVMNEMIKLQENRHNFELSVEQYEKDQAAGAKATKKSVKKTHDPSDTLIEEIKTSKKKVTPEGKQKEQIEIIENFIKTKPSIAKNKPAAAPASDDLAEKSLLYGDNIVSETLVEILLKQGKTDKAIEVLKKLIWKFPQKKAYFAARIEELKNK